MASKRKASLSEFGPGMHFDALKVLNFFLSNDTLLDIACTCEIDMGHKHEN